QSMGARRLLLHEPQGISDAQRRVAHHRAHSLEEPDRSLLRADDRRPEDLPAAVVSRIRDRRQAGMGLGRALRVRLRGKQPMPGREMRVEMAALRGTRLAPTEKALLSPFLD